MPSNLRKNRNQSLSEEITKVLDDFDNLNVDGKLAALYFMYEKMGESITPAAPNAADPDLAPMLLGDFMKLSHEKQLQVMRDIVACKETDYSSAYGALTANNQLLVWFIWATQMGKEVVDIPKDAATASMNSLIAQIENLTFDEQISMFREIAENMGYTNVQPIPTQAETGKTSSL
jgi:Orange carotenoid protein, N-terminal